MDNNLASMLLGVAVPWLYGGRFTLWQVRVLQKGSTFKFCDTGLIAICGDVLQHRDDMIVQIHVCCFG